MAECGHGLQEIAYIYAGSGYTFITLYIIYVKAKIFQNYFGFVQDLALQESDLKVWAGKTSQFEL